MPEFYPLAPKPLLAENVLFLDGISRSGKKLSCRLLSQFSNIEYFNYVPTVERECHRLALGHSDAQTTARNIQILIDEATYARAIGRNLNTRASDETSIFRAAEHEQYLLRADAPDGQPAIDLFLKNERVPLYHTHSVLPFVDVIFEAFPLAQIVHMTRNPVDIAEDWLRRGWGERWGHDPRAFGINTLHDDVVVPWYAAAWGKDYIDMSPAERCVTSVMDLQMRERAMLDRLAPGRKAQILQLHLERLLTEPRAVVEQIETFLGQSAQTTIKSFLEAEKLPNQTFDEVHQSNLALFTDSLRPEILDRLLAANDAYVQHVN